MKDVTAPSIVSGDSKVADYKTLQVVFDEKVKESEAGLKVTVSGSEATATISEDGKSILISKKDGSAFSAGTLNVVVNGLTDEAGNALAEDSKVSITKEQSYVKDFTFVTTALQDAYKDKDADDSSKGTEFDSDLTIDTTHTKAEFSAVDQYGEDVTGSALDSNYKTEVDAKIVTEKGDYPLQTKLADDHKTVLIAPDQAIKDGAKITITLTSKVTDEDKNTTVKATKTQTFDVKKYDADAVSTATDIKSIKRTKDTVIDTEDNKDITLEAALVNKLGTSVDSAKIKWVIDNTDVLKFADEDEKTTNKTVAGAKSINLTAVGKGTATVTAYLTSDITKSASITLEVGQSTLKEIKTYAFDTDGKVEADAKASFPVTNNEVTKIRLTPNNGATIPVDKLQATVQDITNNGETKATKENISVTYSTTEEGYVDASVKTTEKGTYKIVISVGDPAAQDAIKTDVLSIQSTYLNEVSDFTIGVPETNELTTDANSPVVKPLTFTNKYGELITCKKSNMTTSTTKGVNVTLMKDKTNAAGSEDVVKYIKYVGTGDDNDAGEATVTVNAGTVSKSAKVTIAKKASMKNIAFASDRVEVINGDQVEKKDDESSYKDSDGNIWKLVPITFFNSYDKETDATLGTNQLTILGKDYDVSWDIENIALTDAATTKVQFFTDKKIAAKSGEKVAYIAVRSAATDATDKSLSLKLKLKEANPASNTTAKEFSKAITVTQKAARVVKTIKIDSDNAKLVQGASKKFTVTGTDNYGDPIALDENKFSVESDAAGITLPSKTPVDGKPYQKELTLQTTSAVAAGTYNINIKYTDGDLVKKVPVTVIVDQASKLIDAVSIDDKVAVTVDSNTTDYTLSDTTYLPTKIGSADVSKYQLSATALDADGKEVSYNSSDVTYALVSSSFVDTTTDKPVASVTSAGAVTISNLEKVQTGDSITVKATSKNGKETTKTIKFAAKIEAVAKPVKGTQYFAVETKKPLEEVNVDETYGFTDLLLEAKDQYNNLYSYSAGDIDANSDDTTVATVDKVEGKIRVTAVAEGETTLRVISGGEAVASIKVVVSDKAAEAGTTFTKKIDLGTKTPDANFTIKAPTVYSTVAVASATVSNSELIGAGEVKAKVNDSDTQLTEVSGTWVLDSVANSNAQLKFIVDKNDPNFRGVISNVTGVKDITLVQIPTLTKTYDEDKFDVADTYDVANDENGSSTNFVKGTNSTGKAINWLKDDPTKAIIWLRATDDTNAYPYKIVLTRPAAPTDVKVALTGTDGEVKISGLKKSAEASTYQVYYDGTWNDISSAVDSDGAVTVKNLTGVNNTKKVKIRLKATSDLFASVPTEEINVTAAPAS